MIPIPGPPTLPPRIDDDRRGPPPFRDMLFANHHVRLPRRRQAAALPVAIGLVILPAAAALAADTSPKLVAQFTRQVQPLILNKCAAGACHGGPSAHPPQFQRGDVSGRLDRGTTLANIESLTAALGTRGDLSAFLATVSRRHPAGAATGSLQLAPLTPQERTTLEQWLVAATGKLGTTELTASRSLFQPAAAATTTKPPATPAPNRFRAMLEAAANPLPLPLPQEPRGIILGNDRNE